MYEGDSFLTLTLWGRIGLVLVSTGLAVATLAAGRLLMRGRALALRIAMAGGMFFLFVWLAPQVHYTYYQMIFEGLPRQSVVKTPPSPVDLSNLLTFRAAPTLSDHATALFGWILFGIAALRR